MTAEPGNLAQQAYEANVHKDVSSPDAVHAPSQHGHGPGRSRKRPLLSFDEFCFAYEDQPVLNYIDLDIEAGDCAVLMGYNGSGKSTLLRAMNGLVFGSYGTYRFDGEEVTEARMKDPVFSARLHQRIGFVFQDSDAQLFCASVQDEIAFGPCQMGLSDEEVAKRVEDVIELLELGKLRDRAPYHLSGGEKKKVAIACILSMNPDVLCFDEPLNGLDIKTRSWLLGFMGQLKEAGKTLIISTHDQSLADSLADYFVYMGPWHEYTDKPHVHINY